VGYGHEVARTRKLFAALTRRGPNQVLRGDLAFAGLPGIVYTPASGFNLPGVAFGHDWLTPVDRYTKTLQHLASWGIVAAAPNTERGPAPSVLNLAFDLGTTLDIITGVRLGPGRISVHPTKLGIAGHGFGGSAAVFAAAGLSGAGKTAPKAVAALFPSVTKPPAQQPAATLKVPGLVLSSPDDPQSLRTDARDLAEAWPGAVLHIVRKGQSAGLPAVPPHRRQDLQGVRRPRGGAAEDGEAGSRGGAHHPGGQDHRAAQRPAAEVEVHRVAGVNPTNWLVI